MFATSKTMTPAREQKIRMAIGRRKVKNIDSWARSFARACENRKS